MDRLERINEVISNHIAEIEALPAVQADRSSRDARGQMYALVSHKAHHLGGIFGINTEQEVAAIRDLAQATSEYLNPEE